MKINKNPCHIIQVFTNSYEYSKEFKDYESRKEFVQWKSEICSESIIEDKVIISRNCYENRMGIMGNLVVLIDNNFHTYDDFLNLMRLGNQKWHDESGYKNDYQRQNKERKKLLLGRLGHVFQDLEIFKIRIKENIELFIHWTYWKIGEPQRKNFKIAELHEGLPINIKIDGKRDFSMTGRRKRTFLENNYIIEYKGIFEEVQVLKEDKIFIKKVPEQVKEINLMKYVK